MTICMRASMVSLRLSWTLTTTKATIARANSSNARMKSGELSSMRCSDTHRLVQAILQAEEGDFLVEHRPEPAGDEAAPQSRIAVFALVFVGEEILRDDHFAFHARHFDDMLDAADAVAHTLDLDDHV